MARQEVIGDKHGRNAVVVSDEAGAIVYWRVKRTTAFSSAFPTREAAVERIHDALDHNGPINR